MDQFDTMLRRVIEAGAAVGPVCAWGDRALSCRGSLSRIGIAGFMLWVADSFGPLARKPPRRCVGPRTVIFCGCGENRLYGPMH